ncbi:AAA family ATPase [Nocardioides sp. LHG3406-4]|uniref:AAA family ATPase n=1 Tax=Nocardioides sp. LHG3406-4 TaxID=2804575 RepID=UPI003CE8DD3A
MTSDGSSVYTPTHKSRLHISASSSSRSDRLEAASEHGRQVVAPHHLAQAMNRSPLPLTTSQRLFVTELASGRGVQLALAPAGTGKITALAVLTDAWRHAGGTVIDLRQHDSVAHCVGVPDLELRAGHLFATGPTTTRMSTASSVRGAPGRGRELAPRQDHGQ